MPFTEDAILGTMQSPYAETKRHAELLAWEYHERFDLDVTVLRKFTVFGAAGRPYMAPSRFIKWIDGGSPITLYRDGSASLDFTYVDDIASSTILAGKLREYEGVRKQGDGMIAGHAPNTGLAAEGVDAGGNPEGASGYNFINLGGGRNPLSYPVVIGMSEKALGKKA